jgi:hypothetical protein
LNQQWLTPNALLKGLACLEGLPLSAGGAHRRRALHTAYQLNQALARNILIFEPQMRLGTRLFVTGICFVCLFTEFVFVYELAGARSLFEEGGSVAGPERGL